VIGLETLDRNQVVPTNPQAIQVTVVLDAPALVAEVGQTYVDTGVLAIPSQQANPWRVALSQAVQLAQQSETVTGTF
jgi:hypothetical protein